LFGHGSTQPEAGGNRKAWRLGSALQWLGLPALTGFTSTFAMAALFLAGCVVAGLLIPAPIAAVPSSLAPETS
jgi:hypothetical protein